MDARHAPPTNFNINYIILKKKCKHSKYLVAVTAPALVVATEGEWCSGQHCGNIFVQSRFSVSSCVYNECRQIWPTKSQISAGSTAENALSNWQRTTRRKPSAPSPCSSSQ